MELKELDFVEKLQKIGGENFLSYKVFAGKNRDYFIFYDPTICKYGASVKFLNVDGTHNLFSQSQGVTFTTKVVIDGNASLYCFAIAITLCFDNQIYTEIFRDIKNATNIGRNLEYIMGDFELAYHISATEVWSQATFLNCLFHWLQAILRKVASEGMSKYRGFIAKIMKELFLNTATEEDLLPNWKVTFYPLKNFIMTKIKLKEATEKLQKNIGTCDGFKRFIVYMEFNWIGVTNKKKTAFTAAPRYNRNGVFHFSQKAKDNTNNASESTHSKLKRSMGKEFGAHIYLSKDNRSLFGIVSFLQEQSIILEGENVCFDPVLIKDSKSRKKTWFTLWDEKLLDGDGDDEDYNSSTNISNIPTTTRILRSDENTNLDVSAILPVEGVKKINCHNYINLHMFNLSHPMSLTSTSQSILKKSQSNPLRNLFQKLVQENRKQRLMI